MEILRLALVGGLVGMDTTAALQVMISQPLVGGVLAGWAVGDPWIGGFVGLLFQGLYLAELPIGGRVFPDGNLGTVQAAALTVAIQSQLHVSLGVSMLMGFFWSLAMSWAGGQLTIWIRRLHAVYLPLFDRFAAADRPRAIDTLYLLILGENVLLSAAFTVIAYVIGLSLATILLGFFSNYQGLASWGLSLRGALLGVGGAVIFTVLGGSSLRRKSWALGMACLISAGLWVVGY